MKLYDLNYTFQVQNEAKMATIPITDCIDLITELVQFRQTTTTTAKKLETYFHSAIAATVPTSNTKGNTSLNGQLILQYTLIKVLKLLTVFICLVYYTDCLLSIEEVFLSWNKLLLQTFS